MRLKEKNLLQKFAATLKKFSAQGAKKVEYGMEFCFEMGFFPAITILKILMSHKTDLDFWDCLGRGKCHMENSLLLIYHLKH